MGDCDFGVVEGADERIRLWATLASMAMAGE